MLILLAGDTGGHLEHCRYLLDVAAALHCDRIVQLGDFNFYEHIPAGVDFLDEVNDYARGPGYSIPWYAIHGNHDKVSQTLELYGDRRDAEGFVIVRDNVRYVPDGHRWTWAGARFIALGGAYSVDKHTSLKREEQDAERAVKLAEAAAEMWGMPSRIVRYSIAVADCPAAESRWFPEEEMTDAQLAAYLAADPSPVDVMLTHDKPRAANIGQPLLDLPDCMPNQDRLQRAVVALQPKVLAHGHFHHRYTDHIRSGDGDRWTRVEGLGADPRGIRLPSVCDQPYRPEDSWMVLDLSDGAVEVVDLDAATVGSA